MFLYKPSVMATWSALSSGRNLMASSPALVHAFSKRVVSLLMLGVICRGREGGGDARERSNPSYSPFLPSLCIFLGIPLSLSPSPFSVIYYNKKEWQEKDEMK